uniref:La-related protein 6-like isoform X3 n=1 Tax=Geotrypetes seraphini TaxID=260995 RepID=A0A6P8RYG2_GEOSA|nr:la-related protein 6-like isoform X3 [Geotrypetes seraphini]
MQRERSMSSLGSPALTSSHGFSLPLQVCSTWGYPQERSHHPCRLALDDCLESFSGSSFDDDFFENDCQAPDQKLIGKIVSQVEFYLSDDNLAKDAFLLKHVRKNRLGFVSIKLLTSFKKVKYLTRDWKVTLYALQFSEALEINEEGTKVRRKTPIPESLLSVPPGKVLLAWNLVPQDLKNSIELQKNMMELVTKTFSPYGAIASIRILKPGKELPVNVKRSYLSRHPELLAESSALVEYETIESALKAYEELSGSQCPGSMEGIKVILLSRRGTKKKNGLKAEDAEEIDVLDKRVEKQMGIVERLQYSLEDSSSFYSSSESDGIPSSPIVTHKYLSSQAFASSGFSNPTIAFLSNSCSSPAVICKTVPYSHCALPLAAELGSGGCISPGTSPEPCKFPESSSESGFGSGSPWVQCRKAAAYNFFIENRPLSCSPVAARARPCLSGPSPEVIRFPHGPDGTKGFHNSIGRGKVVLRH